MVCSVFQWSLQVSSDSSGLKRHYFACSSLCGFPVVSAGLQRDLLVGSGVCCSTMVPAGLQWSQPVSSASGGFQRPVLDLTSLQRFSMLSISLCTSPIMSAGVQRFMVVFSGVWSFSVIFSVFYWSPVASIGFYSSLLVSSTFQ